MYCSKYFILNNLLKHYINLIKWVLLLSLFYRLETETQKG
jgi:hypothetical protein